MKKSWKFEVNVLNGRCVCWVLTWAHHAFRQPSSHASSTWSLCCRVQENGSVSPFCSGSLWWTLLQLASNAEDYDCKWVFSRIFFTTHYICEAEPGAGIHKHRTTCMSESVVMRLTPNTYSENTKSFDLVSPFLQLWLPNWSSAKAPCRSNLIMPYICVLTDVHYRRTRLDVRMYIIVAVTALSIARYSVGHAQLLQ